MEKQAQRPGLGVFWMVVTGFCFVAVTALVKIMGGRVPAAESAFLRYLLGLVFLIPLWPTIRQIRLTSRQWKLFSARAVVHTGAVCLWFFAMTRIPIAEVTAMNYLNPVYVTVLAVFVLGEKLALRRILAIAAAFLGAMIILRPGFRELDLGHIAMLVTAVFFAGSYLLAKILSGEVSPVVVVTILSITTTIGLAPLAWLVWVPPSLFDVTILFAVAALATLGHYTMTLAFAMAPMTVTQPVTFLQLIWATAVGALFFAEPLDPWVIAGGSVIMGAVIFITWREAVLKRRVTPVSNATKT